jgi:hypothetical protein
MVDLKYLQSKLKKLLKSDMVSIIEVELVKSKNNCETIKESKPH